MTFVGVWRDHPKEHKVKADADKEKGERWLDFRQGFRPSVSKTMGWEQLPDLNTPSGEGPKGQEGIDRRKASMSEFKPVQQICLVSSLSAKKR